MKRLLALTLASVMMVSSSFCSYATDGAEQGGSPSITAEELKQAIEDLQQTSADQNAQIEELTKQVKARQKITVEYSSGGGGGSSSSVSTPTSSGNSVSYGSNIVYQGGKIEINGGRSNVTFTITAPNGGAMTSAKNLAGQVGGSLINCVNTSSPGVNCGTAKVNFYVSGVQAGDNIAAYQSQNGKWVQIPVVEIRKDHVVVTMSQHGTIAFVRVPVLASIG